MFVEQGSLAPSACFLPSKICCGSLLPAKAPWKELGVEIVIEGTGAFNDLAGSSKHIEAGAKKVVITAPGKNCPTYVCGVNEDKYNPATENVVSNAQSSVEETGIETHQIFPFRILCECALL